MLVWLQLEKNDYEESHIFLSRIGFTCFTERTTAYSRNKDGGALFRAPFMYMLLQCTQARKNGLPLPVHGLF